jgi:hypothetical protein
VVFELDLDGVHLSCSSPIWTKRLIERGARFVEEAQAEDLRLALEEGRVTSATTSSDH